MPRIAAEIMQCFVEPSRGRAYKIRFFQTSQLSAPSAGWVLEAIMRQRSVLAGIKPVLHVGSNLLVKFGSHLRRKSGSRVTVLVWPSVSALTGHSAPDCKLHHSVTEPAIRESCSIFAGFGLYRTPKAACRIRVKQVGLSPKQPVPRLNSFSLFQQTIS